MNTSLSQTCNTSLSSDYDDLVSSTNKILKEDTRWKRACNKYADQIWRNNEQFHRSFCKAKAAIKNYPNLVLYSCVSDAGSDSRTDQFDLRYSGQSVARIIVKDETLQLQITPKQSNRNKNSFKIDVSPSPSRRPYDWNSEKVKHFLGAFNNIKSDEVSLNIKEHSLESFILKEMAKSRGKENVMPFVQPIKLSGFFQMRTAFAASRTHQPVLSVRQRDGALSGGGIDILARVDHGSRRWERFAVVELKDDVDNLNEQQPVVMKQALIYATFIANLLRDKDCGCKWYNIFREKYEDRDVRPKNIHIDVVTMMPPIGIDPTTGKQKYESYEQGEIHIDDLGVTLHLFSCYVDLTKSGSAMFSGTFIDSLRKK